MGVQNTRSPHPLMSNKISFLSLPRKTEENTLCNPQRVWSHLLKKSLTLNFILCSARISFVSKFRPLYFIKFLYDISMWLWILEAELNCFAMVFLDYFFFPNNSSSRQILCLIFVFPIFFFITSHFLFALFFLLV